MIRDDPSSEQLKTCLVDYEFCCYDDLVNDKASRFVNQLFDFAGKRSEKSSGYKIPEEQKRRIFIREYLRGTKTQKKLFRNSEDAELLDDCESINDVLEEAEIDQWMKE